MKVKELIELLQEAVYMNHDVEDYTVWCSYDYGCVYTSVYGIEKNRPQRKRIKVRRILTDFTRLLFQ